MSSLKYWLWLSGRKGIAGQTAMRVLNHFGSPERTFFSDEGEYRLIEGLSETAVLSLMDKSLDRANRILGDCDRLDIRVLTLQDAAYPERLVAIHQPPIVLYMKGRPVTIDEEVAIAIVGTRAATSYGAWMSAQLALDLTRGGALVVSGMAQGIDAAALQSAIRAGGPVVSVLGGGIDVVYPKQNWRLYEEVPQVGTLISEYPPGTEHAGSHFPIRNRIISGLSVGVVAVESKVQGGSLLTVGHALDQDRDVFAVPGPVGSPESEGTNRLIQEGSAKLILSAQDILCEYTDRFPGRLRSEDPLPREVNEYRVEQAVQSALSEKPEVSSIPKAEPVQAQPDYVDWEAIKQKLTGDEQTVLLVLGEKCVRADDLVETTQLQVRRVLSALTMLQIKGYVTQESGKRFRAAVRLKME